MVRGTRAALVVREGVLPRVAVIALGAVLLVITAYLIVQVNAGPRRGEASLPLASGPQGAPPAAGERTGDEPVAPAASPAAAVAGGAAPVAPAAPGAAVAAAAGGSGAIGAPVGPLGAAATTPAAAKLAYDEAYKLYDRRDFEEARALALSLLRDDAMAVKMRRIVVASSCAMGDQEVAQQHYLLLPEKDRGDMRQRCAQYGAGFREQ